MTVLQLDIMPADDPNGTPLVTLTDEDVASFEMRVAENSLGAGSFTIRRDHASATDANLAKDNYVKVTIPVIDEDPVFGFFLEHHDDLVLASGEEGAETLKCEGPGSLAIIGRAAFLDEHYAPAPPASDDRGSGNEIAGYWRWQHKQYGQIFVRLIEEGQNQPGIPLDAVTLDFDRDVDSDGVDWPSITRDVRFEIGTDGLTFMDRFAQTGEVFITMDPDLEAHARQARGTDRHSASFGTGKVRFVKGVNIQTELTREADTVMAATHAIVMGMENNIVRVVSPTYTSGPGKWITVHYDNSNDTGVLQKVGLEHLARGVADLQEITMEIRAGDDEATGLYLPFKHFNVSDLCTLHTGSGSADYNEVTERIRAFTIALRDATDDTAKGLVTGEEMAARSLIVGVEIGGPAGSFGIDLNVTVPEKGCGGCPEPPPFECVETDFTVPVEGGPQLSCIIDTESGVADDRVCRSDLDNSPARKIWLYAGATYRVRYTVFHGSLVHNLTTELIPQPGGGGGWHFDAGPASTGGVNLPLSGWIYDTAGYDQYYVVRLADFPTSGASGEDSEVSAEVIYVEGPDPRFEDLGPGCDPTEPVSGQPVRHTFEGDGSTTSYTTPSVIPYRASTLRIKVGGLDWTLSLTEIDPNAGTYDLAYAPPLGATVELQWVYP